MGISEWGTEHVSDLRTGLLHQEVPDINAPYKSETAIPFASLKRALCCTSPID